MKGRRLRKWENVRQNIGVKSANGRQSTYFLEVAQKVAAKIAATILTQKSRQT